MRAPWKGPGRGARRYCWLAALVCGTVSSTASAGSMDFALERLVQNEGCRTADGQIVPGAPTCQADEDAFKRLVNQYGMALAPTAMYPAHTTGYGGFEIALEGAYTTIDPSQSYWQKGTRGPSDPTTG